MSPLVRIWFRVLWQFRTIQGWRTEGPFPHPDDPAILLFGPGLSPHKEWGQYALIRSEAAVLDPLDASTPSPTRLIAVHAEDRSSIEQVVRLAHRHGLHLHLVQCQHRHRRIRCNTGIAAGPNLSRLTDYIERIFSYSGG